MEPNSVLLVIVLLVLAGAALVAVARVRLLVLKIVGGLLTVLLSVTAGMAVVNDYYGYYQTWSQLSADLSGSYARFDTSAAMHRHAGPVRARSAAGDHRARPAQRDHPRRLRVPAAAVLPAGVRAHRRSRWSS